MPNSFHRFYLEGYGDGSQRIWRIAIERLPLLIGRSATADVSLPSGKISQHHAELFESDGLLWIRDLGSTNGTFVDRRRVESETQIKKGDVLHFADLEFRLMSENRLDSGQGTTQMDLRELDLPSQLNADAKSFYRLLRLGSVETFFQRIVKLDRGQTVAHEALCRGLDPNLPRSPKDLFAIAGELGLEKELSQLCRLTIVDALGGSASETSLYINVHPREIDSLPELTTSLQMIRTQLPDQEIVLEVHETTAVRTNIMARLRAELNALDIGLAYDDFGAGQARFLELAEVPPDVVKFDIGLIQGIDRATEARRKLVGSLVAMARDLGIDSLAEGVETAEEADACRELGFDLGQGFFFGRPKPAGPGTEALSAPGPNSTD